MAENSKTVPKQLTPFVKGDMLRDDPARYLGQIIEKIEDVLN